MGEAVRVKLEYQQGSTASRVAWQEQRFDAAASEGTAEFAVTGDDYFKGGRVLAWRCTLYRGERVVSVKQSYLWE